MAERRPKESTKKTPVGDFGSPDWLEDHVIPKGERGALLWRHLKGIWGDDLRHLEKDWNHFSRPSDLRTPEG